MDYRRGTPVRAGGRGNGSCGPRTSPPPDKVTRPTSRTPPTENLSTYFPFAVVAMLTLTHRPCGKQAEHPSPVQRLLQVSNPEVLGHPHSAFRAWLQFAASMVVLA